MFPSTPSQSKPRKLKSAPSAYWVYSVLFFLLCNVFAVYIVLNRQHLIDQLVAWRYDMPAVIKIAAERTKLSDLGMFYVKASQTEFDDRAEFNRACGSLQNEKTIVIGCYTGKLRRVYVFNVTDPRLDGVRETSLAHEMLHAAYDRLSESERRYVDGLLVAQEKTITDPRLKTLIAQYRVSEPGEVVNELHSIFGTEVRQLSPELETYYRRYFTDRTAVVGLKEAYEHVFTALDAEQNALVQQLNAIAADVNKRQAGYTAQLQALNTDIANFNTWTKSRNATRAEYEVRRAGLQSRIADIEKERVGINAQIDSYNTKKATLDALNVQAAGLNHSIDSKLAPGPTL